MLSSSLKRKKIEKVKTQKFQRKKKEKQFFNQIVIRVIVKNKDLSNSKKLVEYYRAKD